MLLSVILLALRSVQRNLLRSFLTILGIVILYQINPKSALFGAVSIFLYVCAYTPLKTVTSLSVFVGAFPGAIPFYDNTGDIDSSELCAGSALFAAHDAMDRVPFNSPVAWGIEPNPARDSVASPLDFFGSVRYVYGSVRNWDAKSRYSIEGVAHEGITPIVAIRGDEYTTVNVRIAAAKQWGPRVAPYNGIVVVHGVSVEQMEGLTR